MAFHVDVEVVLPLPTRAGRDSNRVIETPCFANGSSSSCIAPGSFATDTTSDVWSCRSRGRLPADHHEARRLWGSSWIARDVRGHNRCGALAGDRRDARSLPPCARPRRCSIPPGARGAARSREPALALRERLRMRAHARHAVERAGRGQQIVMNRQRQFAADGQRRLQQQIEVRDTAPSAEFSTGTTPNSAAPASTERNTSSIDGHGRPSIE